VKDPTKLEVKNSTWKSVETRKRNIQCQNISWSYSGLHCYTSTSNATPPGVLSIIQ